MHSSCLASGADDALPMPVGMAPQHSRKLSQQSRMAPLVLSLQLLKAQELMSGLV